MQKTNYPCGWAPRLPEVRLPWRIAPQPAPWGWRTEIVIEEGSTKSPRIRTCSKKGHEETISTKLVGSSQGLLKTSPPDAFSPVWKQCPTLPDCPHDRSNSFSWRNPLNSLRHCHQQDEPWGIWSIQIETGHLGIQPIWHVIEYAGAQRIKSRRQ